MGLSTKVSDLKPSVTKPLSRKNTYKMYTFRQWLATQMTCKANGLRAKAWERMRHGKEQWHVSEWGTSSSDQPTTCFAIKISKIAYLQHHAEWGVKVEFNIILVNCIHDQPLGSSNLKTSLKLLKLQRRTLSNLVGHAWINLNEC